METNDKKYVGDGVYIESDGWGWWLTTQNSINRIYIDGPDMAKKLSAMMLGEKRSGR
tara:strand:+ start:2099 stop:2269 length:171 start_codon:yes stop_codon:yes gene_type:complete